VAELAEIQQYRQRIPLDEPSQIGKKIDEILGIA
jgi:hypothetical protein